MEAGGGLPRGPAGVSGALHILILRFPFSDGAATPQGVPPSSPPLPPAPQPPAMTSEEVRTLFLHADQRLREDMLVVTCSGARLAEVRICVDADLEPRSCGRGNRMQCPRDTPLRIPWSR